MINHNGVQIRDSKQSLRSAEANIYTNHLEWSDGIRHGTRFQTTASFASAVDFLSTIAFEATTLWLFLCDFMKRCITCELNVT
jgi:hypothetical protein